ncbi:VOC family protein [Niabella sp.]|uniref:VOC family protein n=1 Tax=Niabella sp. TaxID=1962976 RepID=UPI002637DD6B|nr:VOC family protein [Niabella sp.]
MEQRISVLTIAANDLPAMTRFYEEKLGWKPVAGNQDIVFYKMNGFLLSIGKRKDLAGFMGVDPAGTGFRPIIISYNVPAEDEVESLYEQLRSKGVKMLGAPATLPFGGRFFYFEDIEGNIFEVAYNTYIPLDEKHNAIGHHSIDHL